MNQPIVLFGGTFNPIHHGHLIVARAAAEHFGFRRITLVPAALSPHKTSEAPGADGVEPTAGDRLAMVRLAVAGDGLFAVSEVDLERPPPSYTCDTLRDVRAAHGLDAPLYWIIGADMLADLPTWRRAEDVVSLANIITVSRPGFAGRTEAILADLRAQLPGDLVDKLAGGVVSTPLVDISSTDIRRRVAAGRPIGHLTPESVVGYIDKRGLYGRAAPRRK